MALPLRVPEPSGSAILISGEQQHLPMPLVSALTHVTRTPDITASAGESPRTHESRHDRGLVVVGVESADSTQFDDTSSGNTHPDDSIGAFGVAHEADVHKWQQEGISGEVLPPYVAQGAPPVYTEEKEEPLTTTQFLFFFGFQYNTFLWAFGRPIIHHLRV
ncbi:hypothetical protein AX16_010212 [Volvariella volvacea WC 439]|nr:hypothetical protein AX16_010212 [Volvariella volvacea WC 439]